jgi:glucan phosphoethanolaminetransferase (alkaline phosphatase superfamily)
MSRTYFYCIFAISSFPSIFGAIFNEFKDVGVSCGTDNKPSIISRTLSFIYLVIAVCISACEIILIFYKIRKLPKELLSAIKNKIIQGVGLYAISTLSIVVIPVGGAMIFYMIHGKYIASEYLLALSGYVVGILYAGIFFMRKEHVEVSPFCLYAILLL